MLPPLPRDMPHLLVPILSMVSQIQIAEVAQR